MGDTHAALVVKNPLPSAGDRRDMGSVPGLGRPPGGGHGNPLQYSCLENPTDRGAQWAIVHGVAQSQIRPKRLSRHIISRIFVLIIFTTPEIYCSFDNTSHII